MKTNLSLPSIIAFVLVTFAVSYAAANPYGVIIDEGISENAVKQRISDLESLGYKPLISRRGDEGGQIIAGPFVYKAEAHV